MALFDFLKKSKKIQPHQAPKRPESKEKEKQEKQEPKKEEGLKPIDLRSSRIAWRVLSEPHVTEKTTHLTKWNQYVFRVQPGVAHKGDIKRAVEEIYGVHVENVRKISVPGKKRRRGRHVGWRSGYQKAIVTLRAGEKIEVLPH